MSMLDIHADALNGDNTTYHEFLLRYKARTKVVYGIVEGKEDPMFYRSVIESILPSGWSVELLRAGSKQNVIRARFAFDWSRFSRKRIRFFVDRDLSDFIPDGVTPADNLYITNKVRLCEERATI
uniref:Uncharacterized protein n=1 Tax=Candidatus Kentrum sp. MB TaxID=2138164 RepID=A0A450XPM0_9GAMM|nr:MAG: Protein of unknown function (DUF4435) [Candidatus Kentron sp. MB]